MKVPSPLLWKRWSCSPLRPRGPHITLTPRNWQKFEAVLLVPLVGVEVHIAGDEQIEPAIAIIVAKGRPARPVAQLHAGLLRGVGEGAIVVVVIEAILAEIGDEQIGPAIVVIVADGYSEAPAVVGHACFCRDIGKGAVVVVVEEGGVGAGALPDSAS